MCISKEYPGDAHLQERCCPSSDAGLTQVWPARQSGGLHVARREQACLTDTQGTARSPGSWLLSEGPLTAHTHSLTRVPLFCWERLLWFILPHFSATEVDVPIEMSV